MSRHDQVKINVQENIKKETQKSRAPARIRTQNPIRQNVGIVWVTNHKATGTLRLREAIYQAIYPWRVTPPLEERKGIEGLVRDSMLR